MATQLTPGEMKDAIQQFVDEVWNQKKYDLIYDSNHDDYVMHWSLGGDVGVSGLEQFVRDVHQGFSDFKVEIEFMVVEDDMIAIGASTSGTHDGDFMGIPPTNQYVESHAMWAERFEGEKTAETWASWDAFDTLRQIGAIPEEAAPEMDD